MKNKFRLLYVVVALVLVLTLSSTSFVVSADEIEAATESAETVDITEEVKETAPVFSGVEEFEKIAELGGLRLYRLEKTNEWICFGVEEIKTGEVWYSMPQNLDSITIATRKKEAKSTGVVTYQNENKNDSYVYTSDAVRKGNYDIEKIENGVRITYEFPKKITETKKITFGFTVPMVFRLTKDGGFEAGVEFTKIKTEKKSEHEIISVAVMPYFGSALYESDGYMFLPDGSGAIIDNDYQALDGLSKRISYQVYGTDTALNSKYSLGKTEPVVLPVFGTKGDDKGFLAVIKDGDAVARVTAMPSRAAVPYTSIYADFTYNYQDTFDTTSNWFNKAYSQVAYGYSMIECCSVVYYPLSGEDSDYIGMAKRYRKYLTEEVGVKPSASANVTLNIDTMGAITKSVSKFGFIVDAIQKVTNFDEAGQMLTELNKSGVKNVDLRMTAWTDGGIKSTFVDSADPESELGGEKELKKLISTAKELKSDLYFDIDVCAVYEGTFFWPIRKVAVRNILNEYAQKGFFRRDNGLFHGGEANYFLVNPKYFEEQINAFTNDFKGYNQSNLSLGSLGSTLYSDFNNGSNFTDRQKSEELIKKALSVAQEKAGSIVVDNGNAYTYAYADKTISLPMYSSGYESTTSDVPFAQIALHGLIEYTESAHNLCDDPTIQFLRMLETGSMPYYMLTWSESTVFLDTEFNDIYSSNFYTWNETAIRDYKTLSSIFDGYCDKEITDHVIITNNVRSTTYGDDLTVVVNYGEKDYDFGGATVKAGSFIVVKEGE